MYECSVFPARKYAIDRGIRRTLARIHCIRVPFFFQNAVHLEAGRGPVIAVEVPFAGHDLFHVDYVPCRWKIQGLWMIIVGRTFDN